MAMDDPAVEQIQPPLTMLFGPRDVLLTMVIQFRRGLSGADAVAAVDRLEKALRAMRMTNPVHCPSHTMAWCLQWP